MDLVVSKFAEDEVAGFSDKGPGCIRLALTIHAVARDAHAIKCCASHGQTFLGEFQGIHQGLGKWIGGRLTFTPNSLIGYNGRYEPNKEDNISRKRHSAVTGFEDNFSGIRFSTGLFRASVLQTR